MHFTSELFASSKISFSWLYLCFRGSCVILFPLLIQVCCCHSRVKRLVLHFLSSDLFHGKYKFESKGEELETSQNLVFRETRKSISCPERFSVNVSFRDFISSAFTLTSSFTVLCLFDFVFLLDLSPCLDNNKSKSLGVLFRV